MKIKFITVGKMRSGPHRAIAFDYIERLGHYTPFEYIPVKDEDAVLKKLSPADFLVVCDEGGRSFSSEQFANFIEERQVRSTKYLTFVVGPAEGLGVRVKVKADLKLAFSGFTIQHDLAVLVLLEQLYRAFTIIRGEAYHK